MFQLECVPERTNVFRLLAAGSSGLQGRRVLGRGRKLTEPCG